MHIRFLLAGVFGCAIALAAQNTPGSVDTAVPPQAGPTAMATLTGCLKGSTDQYYVMEKNGTRHVLVAKNKDLKSLTEHMVTVTGKPDSNRDASSSSDEGSSRGNRFFQVDAISDQGPCK